VVHGKIYKGALLMSSANISFCVMACLVKYVSHLNVYTMTLFRFLIGIGIIGILAMGGRISLSFVNKPGLFFRGLLGGSAIAISFLSITKLGLIKAGIIIQLYPVFATLFAWLLLRERIIPGLVLATIAALFGVYLLLLDTRAGMGILSVGRYEGIALFGAMLGGLAVVSVKSLQKTDSTPTIFFAQCLVGLWIVLLPATVAPGSITLGASLALVAIGLFATAGQLLSTDSYRYLSVAQGSALIMMSPLLNCIAGMALFHEHLSLQTGIGAGIVMVSTGAALLIKQ
jgi:drug/metabolite transporter (DMT)-like permease